MSGPSPTVACAIGCGASITRGHIARHEKLEHVRCSCGAVLVGSQEINKHGRTGCRGSKKNIGHERKPSNRSNGGSEADSMSPAEVQKTKTQFGSQLAKVKLILKTGRTPLPDSADKGVPSPPDENAGANGYGPSATATAQSTGGIATGGYDPSKHLAAINAMLREYWNLEGVAINGRISTRRVSDIATVNEMFPKGEHLPFARLFDAETSDAAEQDCDVWVMTDKQMFELCKADVKFPKPILIPSTAKKSSITTKTFMAGMAKYFGDGNVDVQDFSEVGKNATSMTVTEVLERLMGPQPSIGGERAPINLLNIRGRVLGPVHPTPEFLNLARFDTIPVLTHHLEKEIAGSTTLGKRGATTNAFPTDLAGSSSFGLFAQRGSWTGFHVDALHGTWVHALDGIKVWIFPGRFDDEDRRDFERDGDDWVPKAGVRFLVLEPGATLVMPPGPVIPHAVLSPTDALMCGGMFMDSSVAMETLQNMLWTVHHPNVTNEPIPLQLLHQWDTFRDLVIDENGDRVAAEFDDMTAKFKEALSCDCGLWKNCNCGLSCPCRNSVAQDNKCTPFCHNAEKAARKTTSPAGREKSGKTAGSPAGRDKGPKSSSDSPPVRGGGKRRRLN